MFIGEVVIGLRKGENVAEGDPLAIAGGHKPTLMKRTREMIANLDMDGCTKTQNYLKIFWMTHENTNY